MSDKNVENMIPNQFSDITGDEIKMEIVLLLSEEMYDTLKKRKE